MGTRARIEAVPAPVRVRHAKRTLDHNLVAIELKSGLVIDTDERHVSSADGLKQNRLWRNAASFADRAIGVSDVRRLRRVRHAHRMPVLERCALPGARPPPPKARCASVTRFHQSSDTL